jgi:hypothetical protein
MKLKSLVILAASLMTFASMPAAPQSNAADSSASVDESHPDGTLTLQGGAVAAGIGWVWGHGVVNYQGADHKFAIHGVSVVDVGGSKISATGVVMHLTKLSDFNGTYTAWTAGATLGAGGAAAYMKNEHGVIIKLVSTTEGLRFTLSGDGVKMTLKD